MNLSDNSTSCWRLLVNCFEGRGAVSLATNQSIVGRIWSRYDPGILTEFLPLRGKSSWKNVHGGLPSPSCSRTVLWNNYESQISSYEKYIIKVNIYIHMEIILTDLCKFRLPIVSNFLQHVILCTNLHFVFVCVVIWDEVRPSVSAADKTHYCK